MLTAELNSAPLDVTGTVHGAGEALNNLQLLKEVALC